MKRWQAGNAGTAREGRGSGYAYLNAERVEDSPDLDNDGKHGKWNAQLNIIKNATDREYLLTQALAFESLAAFGWVWQHLARSCSRRLGSFERSTGVHGSVGRQRKKPPCKT